MSNIIDLATEIAKTNPAQTAWTSNETALIFNFFWIRAAVAGKVLSGVVVATIIRSISFLFKLEDLIASKDAK